MYTGTNCTNYVAYRLVTTNGMPNVRPKSGVGNAEDWGFVMSSITNSTPTAGSVAWWGRTGHHVAYVEKVVSSSEIWVSESNWSGAFDWRKITKSGSGWPDGFIHFKDLKILNTSRPAIKGTVKVGPRSRHRAAPGAPPATRTPISGCPTGPRIAGATARTFTPTTAQLGKPLAVRVTATRTSYPTVSATSPGDHGRAGQHQQRLAAGRQRHTPGRRAGLGVDRRPVEPDRQCLHLPVARGRREVRRRHVAHVLARPGARRQAARIRGHRQPQRLPAGDRGLRTRAGDSRAARQHRSAAVIGTPRVGSTLTAHRGAWSKTGLSYAYQWRVDGQAVAAPTGDVRATGPGRGPPVAVEVVASRSGYETDGRLGADHPGRPRGAERAAPAHRCRHTARGSALVAPPGTWSASAEYSYRWYAGGVAVAGATGRTFTPTPLSEARPLRPCHGQPGRLHQRFGCLDRHCRRGLWAHPFLDRAPHHRNAQARPGRDVGSGRPHPVRRHASLSVAAGRQGASRDSPVSPDGSAAAMWAG